MDENPYRSPRETGNRPPAQPVESKFPTVAFAALVAVITITALFYAFAYVAAALSGL
jgi:hypothetical protein